ncbi:DDHD family phospholipase [Tahibacter harae]|uniref:DDHD family phospholipase n=1 Tax=Tahibacter harae TaxID=2963937 RepID=A0ABT1QSN4_9GAMM|nr:DDHD family phospholipase [Tahibacter harae]MCQ4165281.1 DDHD family phospholipase [Tahibacter harae]
MPIVFVHGVNNRDGDSYRENALSRNGFLREVVAPKLGLGADQLTLISPYWGLHGARFAWNMAVLPETGAGFEAFGGDAEAEARGRVAGLLATSPLSGDILADAQRDFPAAVELLFAAAAAGADDENDARELARAYLACARYAEQNPRPAWLAQAAPGNFADQLLYAAEDGGDERFGAGGILDRLKEGLSRLAHAVPDKASSLAVRLVRKSLNASLTTFIGDAFTYLARRRNEDGSNGPIVQVVLDALHQAEQARSAQDDKLIVIAHSFGGEIMYDILSHFAPQLRVDCLITVGSQVGLFEELKLYLASDVQLPPDPPQGRLARPAAVRRWLNVFDTNDVLAYRLEPVVAGVSDFVYDTGYSALGAHGGYFERPSFYRRLAARLAQA